MAELGRGPSRCCAPERQQVCCEPGEKEACCSAESASCECGESEPAGAYVSSASTSAAARSPERTAPSM